MSFFHTIPPPLSHKERSGSIAMTNYLFSGGWSSVNNPASLYHQLNTFLPGVQNQSTNHQGFVWFYNSTTDATPVYGFVGDGTVQTDIFDHPTVAVIVGQDGHLYVFQVNTHNDPIFLWRSIRTAADPACIIQSTVSSDNFTFVTQINPLNAPSGQVYAYHNVRTRGSKIQISARDEHDQQNRFSHVLLEADISDLTTWTHKQLTLSDNNGTTGLRHYNHWLPRFGTCTKEVFLIGYRDLTPNIYRGIGYYETTDHINYRNYDNTFTRTITKTGVDTSQAITHQDSVANLLIYGDPASTSEFASSPKGALVNDVAYICTRKIGTDQGLIIKIENGTLTQHDIQIPGFTQVSAFAKFNIYTDAAASRLILWTYIPEISNFEVWHVSLDLTQWTKVRTYDIAGTEYFTLPFNYDDIPAGTRYMLGGQNVAGEFNYTITNQRF